MRQSLRQSECDIRVPYPSGWRGALARACLWGLWLLAVAPCSQAIDGGRYGDVRLELPKAVSRGYVVLFSDDDGWTVHDQQALEAIAAAGAIGVGVDTRVYLQNIAAGQRPCDQLVGDAEGLSRKLQREYGHEAYWFPILVGEGAGGTLARVTLSQAPGHTFSGAIALNATGLVPGNRPLCAAADAASRYDDDEYRYGALTQVPGFLVIGLTPSASTRMRTQSVLLLQNGTPMQVQAVHGTIADALVTLLAPHLSGAAPAGVDSLPLIELPADHSNKAFAIVISGDGGWRDLDKTIAEDLQRDGLSVVGWDSVRYFWRKKTPEQTAHDVAAVVRWYSQHWNAEHVLLIGYSFGADVLPSVFVRLPADVQVKISLMSLLAFSQQADWEIKVTGILGQTTSSDALPTAPDLARTPKSLIQCFYGSEEKDSACLSLKDSEAQLVQTTGGHHFDHDYGAIERKILEQLQLRIHATRSAEN